MKLNKKGLIPILLVAAGLGCGYSKPSSSATTMPAISQLDPAGTPAGGAQFQLEVDGSNFASNAIVTFNGTTQAVSFVSAGKLEVTIPATAIMNSGTIPVTVTNPGSSGIYGMTSTTSAAMNFTIQ
jgi:hypothetical protein